MWQIWFGALALTVLDFLSKTWARTNLVFGTTQPFIPGFLQLTLTTNQGGAFGLGKQYGYSMTILAFLIFIGIAYWSFKRLHGHETPNIIEKAGMCCLLGGAMGNLLDRMQYGRVTDFLEFAFISFPVFNVADATIDIGIGLIFIAYLLGAKQVSDNNAAKANE
ncbi:MAG: signal peptidase II [Candidatus Obscuribacterales bacterium]|nr:signal peptidase II [Candidatus Obscuribacterales bacterium]